MGGGHAPKQQAQLARQAEFRVRLRDVVQQGCTQPWREVQHLEQCICIGIWKIIFQARKACTVEACKIEFFKFQSSLHTDLHPLELAWQYGASPLLLFALVCSYRWRLDADHRHPHVAQLRHCCSGLAIGCPSHIFGIRVVADEVHLPHLFQNGRVNDARRLAYAHCGVRCQVTQVRGPELHGSQRILRHGGKAVFLSYLHGRHCIRRRHLCVIGYSVATWRVRL
mmetsp:Transcript_23234/g.64194  ORF Transcript_23234/g.64194 Transcript_23234/m.64194 type:complete len:225 (+) Transcript_23234:1187-1861(+)